MDRQLASSRRGMWAVKWSLAVLGLTAAVQAVVVVVSGSVALLADTIHNVGDALTAVPLGAAFLLARRPPTKRYPYGLHRSEDLAGLVIILIIALSALVAGYESVRRLLDPQEPDALLAVGIMGIVGLLGNEAVAVFRIRVGREIGSVALVADGKHARIDGLTSLAVAVGAVAVALGAPIADPLVGLGITIVILRIVAHTARDVGIRILDGVDPDVIDAIAGETVGVDRVTSVGEVRARWLGHSLHAEVNIAVDDNCSVAQGHETAKHVRHRLLESVPHLGDAIVHVDPASESGEHYHEAGAPE